MNTEAKQQIKIQLHNYCEKVGSMNAASKKLNSVSVGTISNVLADKWENISDAMFTSIQKQVNPSLGSWIVVENTKRVQILNKLYADAKEYSEAYCVVAAEGSGKSEPAKMFSERPNVYRVVCAEHLNRKTFLAELLKSMGKETSGYTVYEMMREVISIILKVENPLIILDEADKLSDQVLYFFISIYNATEDKCGIVIQATDFLKKRINRGVDLNKKGFKEIFSRFGRKFIELPANSKKDLTEIIEANGIYQHEEITRIINDSEGDIRRIKRLVKAALRKERSAA